MSFFEKQVLTTVIICRMIENIVLTVGVVFCSVYFSRFSLIWFLLLPFLRTFSLPTTEDDEEKEKENEDRDCQNTD